METYSLSTGIFFISFASTVPQLYQTISTGKTRDLNLWNLVLNTIVNLLLALHGYRTADTGILAIGVWFTLYWGLLGALKWRNLSTCDSSF